MSDSSETLQRLIAASAAEGMHDSQGVFTLASDRAQIKLGQAQLPRPEAWISKVVQAAVAAGAPSVRVRQHRRRTVVHFPVTMEPSMDDLARSLQDPSIECARHTQHLATGLRGLAVQGQRAFRLYVFDARGAHTVFRGAWGQVVRSSAPRAPETTQSLELVVDFQPGEAGSSFLGIGPGTRQAVLEAEELNTYTYCSPIPVKLDGRDLADLEPLAQRRASAVQCLPVRLDGLLPLEGEGRNQAARFGLQVPKRARDQAFGLTRASSALNTYYESLRTLDRERYRALSRVSFYSRGPTGSSSAERIRAVETRSFCNWVLDGVVLQIEPLPLEPGAASLDLFVDASGLPLDLTTFGLVDCDLKTERAAAALHQAAHHLCGWDPESAELQVKSSRGNYLAGGLLVGSAMAANPSTTILGAAMLIGSAVVLARGTRPKHIPPSEMIGTAVKDLRIRLSRLDTPPTPPT